MLLKFSPAFVAADAVGVAVGAVVAMDQGADAPMVDGVLSLYVLVSGLRDPSCTNLRSSRGGIRQRKQSFEFLIVSLTRMPTRRQQDRIGQQHQEGPHYGGLLGLVLVILLILWLTGNLGRGPILP